MANLTPYILYMSGPHSVHGLLLFRFLVAVHYRFEVLITDFQVRHMIWSLAFSSQQMYEPVPRETVDETLN